MELISSGTKFNFLGMKYLAAFFSLILVVGSIYIWIERGPEKFGIDYAGGHELVIKVPQEGSSERIRKALQAHELGNAVVQSFEAGSNEYSVRIGSAGALATEGKDDASVVRAALTKALDEEFQGKAEIIRTDYVGPTIGAELKKKALVALIVGLGGILAYISYRFEFAFALGAVVALFHDVIVSMGVYLLCGFTINVATLAAALTIVGYSVNDTIIVFDRVREEVFKQKKFDLIELINYSINRTLSRTVITSLLTLFAALALLLKGGGAIMDLSLFLVVGVITGTYSTIFIAAPVAMAWENFRHPIREEQPAS